MIRAAAIAPPVASTLSKGAPPQMSKAPQMSLSKPSAASSSSKSTLDSLRMKKQRP